MALSLHDLMSAAPCVRATFTSQPAEGPGEKILPPTYLKRMEGRGDVAQYAFEDRLGEDGVVHTDVLLDSPPSQANRMEAALLQAVRAGGIEIPDIRIHLRATLAHVQELSLLELPHRAADAVLRDCVYGNEAFKDAELGRAFLRCSEGDATALFENAPTSLIFGAWFSQHGLGAFGPKFKRNVVAYIMGVDAVLGVTVSSRIDPLLLPDLDIYEAETGDWTADAGKAVHQNGKPKPYHLGKSKPARTTALNHSNIPPQIDGVKGGVTVRECRHTFGLNVAGLRRLRFPNSHGDAVPKRDAAERDAAAHGLLAALTLCGFTLMHERGYDLRSRCLLIPTEEPRFELVRGAGRVEPFKLDAEGALRLFREAVARVEHAEFEWNTEPKVFMPSEKLVDIIRAGREKNLREVD